MVEFNFNVSCEFIQKAIEYLIQDGFIPILAHPERYECIQLNPEFFGKLTNKNVSLQLNKGSIFGFFGSFAQECAIQLLKEHAYHFIGSDAHHYEKRDPNLLDDYLIIRQYFGDEYAHELFELNALKLLKGEK